MNDRYWMPTRLDDPPMFLLWDLDLVVIFIFILSLGIASGFFFSSAVLGFAAAWGFSRSKGGKHPHYLKHISWWYLPFDLLGLKRTNSAGQRAFLG